MPSRAPSESPTAVRPSPSPLLTSSSQLAVDRVPGSKAGKRRNFKLLRNGRGGSGGGSGGATPADDEEEDDEWAFEDGSTASFPPPASAPGPPAAPIPATLALTPEAGQAEEVLVDAPASGPEPEPRAKRGKGHALVKKTSRLFSRGPAEQSADPPRVARHSSVSSAASSVASTAGSVASASAVSHASAHNHGHAQAHAQHGYGFGQGRPWPGSRSTTRSGPGSSPPSSKHSRRLSHDSTGSWRPGSTRSGSMSTRDSLDPPRAGPASLSASLGPSSSARAPPSPASAATGTIAPAVPSRMSMWFSHLLPTSDAPSQPDAPPSPARNRPSAAASFLNAAKQKAAGVGRYLLDQEAQPDKCEDPIWVMGVAHPGWTPSTPSRSTEDLPGPIGHDEDDGRRGSGSSSRSGRPSPPRESALRPPAWSSRRKEAVASGGSASSSPPGKLGHLFSASTLSLVPVGSPGKDEKADSPRKTLKKDKEVVRWPEQFYDDFRSCVWCTYRSQYAPIAAIPQNSLLPTAAAYWAAHGPPADLAPPSLGASTSSAPLGATSRAALSGWGWARDDRGLTSDAGWGCMLRTGQSMLANALIHHRLGRSWRVPPARPPLEPESPAELAQLEAYAQYVKILSWFLDDPSPLCPFSVHRMALIGKELGKEVGEWFGPSTAAGALKTLANSFAPAGVSVATAADSIIYRSDVFAASNLPVDDGTAPPKSVLRTSSWGKKAVLVLVGIRLGLSEVNPIYYETIKALFMFPQSVGIAGGRPSSSYYFVASQAGSLYYLDPHFTRPAIPLKVPPSPVPPLNTAPFTPIRSPTPADDENPVVVHRTEASPYTLDVVDVDELSSGSETSSPPRIERTVTRERTVRRSPPRAKSGMRPSEPGQASSVPSTPTPCRVAPRHARPSSSSSVQGLPGAGRLGSALPPTPALAVDPQVKWYASAYADAQTRTFHADKVRRMPLSGLDPSMLLGFLCRDEADFDHFCARVAKLPQKIFTVADEPPAWDDDEDPGLESVSEPDPDGDADEGGSDVGSEEVDVATQHAGSTIRAVPLAAAGSTRDDLAELDAGVVALDLELGLPPVPAASDEGDTTPSDGELVSLDIEGTPWAASRQRCGALAETVVEASDAPARRHGHPFAQVAPHPFSAGHAAHLPDEDEVSEISRRSVDGDGGRGRGERGSEAGLHGPAERADTADEADEDELGSMPPTPTAATPLKSKRHLLDARDRARTGSWIEPARGGSAPNGASMV
ncbi:Cysteine protease atg4 [Cryptotrichosporon argae]